MRRDVLLAAALAALLAAAGGAALARLAAEGAAAPYLAQLGVHLAAGREAAIPVGVSLGLGWARSAATAVALEWTMLLAAFALLALAGARLRAWPPARERLDRAHAWIAGRERAGVLALAGLTLAPFLPIGGITSLAVGEALGLRASRLVPAIMAAELGANVLVALAASAIVALLPDPAPAAGALAVAMVLLGVLLARRRR